MLNTYNGWLKMRQVSMFRFSWTVTIALCVAAGNCCPAQAEGSLRVDGHWQGINAAPLPLVETDDSTGRLKTEDEVRRDREREQLTRLWEATFSRSADIDLVMQKLFPGQDKIEIARVLMKALAQMSSFGVWTMALTDPALETDYPVPMMDTMIDYSPPHAVMSRRSSSIITKLQSLSERRLGHNSSRITQTEQIMLYNMIRGIADKLVQNYRAYVNTYRSLKENPSKEFDERLETERQCLVDLAGESAVEDLEMALARETQISAK